VLGSQESFPPVTVDWVMQLVNLENCPASSWRLGDSEMALGPQQLEGLVTVSLARDLLGGLDLPGGSGLPGDSELLEDWDSMGDSDFLAGLR
jgi:hypothetical protein